MKNKLATLLLFLSICTGAQSQTLLNTEIDEYYLGAWAMYQHNAICNSIFDAIESGKLTANGPDAKPLAKKDALKVFQQTYTAFVNTDVNDPTIGHDTMITDFVTRGWYAFNISESQVKISVGKVSKTLSFDKMLFNKYLSEENLRYLEFFGRKGVVNFKDIPVMSKILLSEFNQMLYKHSILDQTTLYSNDSLLRTYNKDDKMIRGKEELVMQVNDDPTDPSVMKDTSIYIEYNFTDTSLTQGLIIGLQLDQLSLKVRSYSATFHPSILGFKLNRFAPIGFIKNDEKLPFSAREKVFIEQLFRFVVADTLGHRYEYDEYVDVFKIQAKN